MTEDEILIAQAPAISGLRFRRFRGAADFPGMLAVLLASAQADRIERNDTVEQLAERYNRLSNCDPYRDLILAEIAGELVGYWRGWWWDEEDLGRLYGLVGFLVPDWRRQGIDDAMLLWLENRLRGLAAGHPARQARFFQVAVSQYEADLAATVQRAGYQPVRYFYEMLRPTLEEIPDFRLPAGLEVRAALPDHYPAIWASAYETSQDEWGYTPPTEEAYQAWLADPHFQPDLWQIAWDVATGQVAGHVLTFIDHDQNQALNRQRGYTEGIGVGRAWRRRGVARALIARSLQAQKAAGMTESALVVDSDSPSGATRLYESCGFQVVQRNAVYRKPFDVQSSIPSHPA